MSRHGSYRLTVSRSDKANSTKYWRGSHLIKEWPFVCSRPRVPPAPESKKGTSGSKPIFSCFLCRAPALFECNYGNK